MEMINVASNSKVLNIRGTSILFMEEKNQIDNLVSEFFDMHAQTGINTLYNISGGY